MAYERENTDEFVIQAAALNSVQMQNSGVRGETGKYGGERVLLRPIDDFREFLPERLVSHMSRVRLRASDDETIDAPLRERARRLVVRFHVVQSRLRTCDTRQRKQAYSNVDGPCGRVYKHPELAFCAPHGLIRHIVDEPNG